MNTHKVKYFRFSISWSRILPTGTYPINQEGVDFYNNLINSLKSNNIEPFVTLYHWDLPQSLNEINEDQNQPNGWTHPSIINNFVSYAELCFDLFGDRIKYWTTFNEPLTFSRLGYDLGIHAPGRCTNRELCDYGNSGTEPYIATHYILLSHIYTVNLYKTKYQKIQGGKIGMTLNCDYAVPLTSSIEDIEAAERSLEFQLGWFIFFSKIK